MTPQIERSISRFVETDPDTLVIVKGGALDYSPGQRRDWHGRFTSGAAGSGGPISEFKNRHGDVYHLWHEETTATREKIHYYYPHLALPARPIAVHKYTVTYHGREIASVLLSKGDNQIRALQVKKGHHGKGLVRALMREIEKHQGIKLGSRWLKLLRLISLTRGDSLDAFDAGFNPSELRNWLGQWTRGGGGGAARAKPVAAPSLRAPMVSGSGRNKSVIAGAIKSLPHGHLRLLGEIAVVAVDLINEARTVGLFSQASKTITVADRYQTMLGKRENRDPVGTTYHEIGHALNRSANLTSPLRSGLAAQMQRDLSKLTTGEQRQAKYFLSGGQHEVFAELYRLAYSPAKKGAFGGDQTRMEQVFSGSIAMLRKVLD
jgi:hypothetical protein